MKAIIINVGDEVLTGKTINTNSSHISYALSKIGIDTKKVIVIGDNKEDLQSEVVAFKNSDYDILITTGGLGPTHDDFTKEVLVETLGLEMELSEESFQSIDKYFNHNAPKTNLKQAMFPHDAYILKNDLGTAPGAIIEHENKTYILLVGPPFELVPMFDKACKYLSKKNNVEYLVNEYNVMGIGESMIEDMLQAYYPKYANVNIAPYASLGKIRYQITALETYKEEYEKAKTEFEEILKEYIVSKENKEIEEVIINILKAKSLTISLAESCTGGMVVSRLINVSGSSSVIKESYVTYSEEAKTKILNVEKKTIDTFGVVSKEVSEAMAQGLKKVSEADIVISVTGIAGPSGASDKEKVGSVYYTIIFETLVHNFHYNFHGNRQMVRERAVMSILYELYKIIK